MLVAWIQEVMLKMEKSELIQQIFIMWDEVVSHTRAVKKGIGRKIKGGCVGIMTVRQCGIVEKSLDQSLGVCLDPNSNSALGLVI